MSSGIDPERWAGIRAAFDALVDLDASGRAARLADIGASDPELRRTLEGLLAADAAAEAMLMRVEAVFPTASANAADEPETAGDPLELAGRVISHFRIIESVAAGGMGIVYRAEDTQLRRTVALKFPLPGQRLDPRSRERFLREARAAGALDHPNLCSIYETGETPDGHLFLVMPLYAGETLRARIAREGRLSITVALAIAGQIAQGLEAAHRAGLVHRDLKPANVMLLPDGGVRILDFGLVRVSDLTHSASRATLGTIAYMAPEQVRGEPVDPRTDLWALGALLHEMLTGRRPFASDHEIAVAHAILHTEPTRVAAMRPEAGAALDEIVHRLLAKDPEERYPSAAEVHGELAALAARPASTTSRALAADMPAVGVADRRRRTPWLTAALGLLVPALAFGAWLGRHGPASTAPATRTLAVLPFQDISTEAGGDYLAIGIGEAITTELARVRAVIMPGEFSTRSYLGSDKPVPQIATELGVGSVLQGRAERFRDRVRLDMRLLDGGDAQLLWTQRFERPVAELHELQRDVAQAVVAALRVDVTDEERAVLSLLPTRDATAYDLYLRGWEIQRRGSPEDIDRLNVENLRAAQSFFWQAVERDPAFAIARARLAMTHVYSAMRYDTTEARRAMARLEAENALRYRPGLPEAHDALAFYWGVLEGDPAKSREHITLALGGFPNSADLRLNLGISHRTQGALEAAIPEFEQAMQLDPRYPGPFFHAALVYSRLRRYPESVRAWDHVIELAPHEYGAQLIRGYVYVRWHGTADTLLAAVERIPAEWNQNGMKTFAHFQALRLLRRYRDGLAALDAPPHPISRDNLVFYPVTLMRAQLYESLGEAANARASYEAARDLLVDSSAARPDDAGIRIALAMAWAGLGRKAEAAREVQQAMALTPLSRNLLTATATMGLAAEVYSRIGETELALGLLELLLAIPAGREASVPYLRVEPNFDPIRSDPRFQELLDRFSRH